MIYHLFHHLSHQIALLQQALNPAFCAITALITAFILSLLAGKWYIARSNALFKAKHRSFTPENHKKKDNTPTMGGLFIAAVSILNTLLWGTLTNPLIWVFVGCFIGFGCIGVLDDWKKITDNKGISPRTKTVLQLCLSYAVIMAWMYIARPETTLTIPFYGTLHIPSLLFIAGALFIIIGTSNAVNITDGLDGLATGALIPVYALFSIIALCSQATADVAIAGAAITGSLCGFLVYNRHPAKIFMGDAGSLPLGACLALLALMTHQELLLALAGGVFVAETISVIVQIASYKIRAQRVFLMAPFHHHLELSGWHETTITSLLQCISLFLSLSALCIFLYS